MRFERKIKKQPHSTKNNQNTQRIYENKPPKYNQNIKITIQLTGGPLSYTCIIFFAFLHKFCLKVCEIDSKS